MCKVLTVTSMKTYLLLILGKIFLHATLGKEVASTLKLHGILCGRVVLMLVDSGWTHDFVAEEIVKKLGLAVQYIPTFGVQIGNGEIIKCNKVCHNLLVEVSNLIIKHDFFPFSFDGVDMVLGIQCLASLNTIQANWDKMFLIFQLNEKTYKLQGVLQRTLTSFQSDLEEQMLTRDAMLKLMKAHSRMKAQTDYKHIYLSSNVDDAALLRLHPYGQKSLLAAQIPDFHLEDKSSSQEGCTDKARVFHTYSRRKNRRKIGEDNDLHRLKFMEVSHMED